MPVTISLAGSGTAVEQLPMLSFLGTKRAPRTAVEKRMLRAVTGGVAISDPAAAVKKLDEPKGDLIGASVKQDDLNKLFDAVEKVVADPNSAPDPNDLERTVARMLGTRPAYVAAVRKVAKGDAAARKAGLAWVASLDVDRLAKAGDRANTEIRLNEIPPVGKKQVALEQRVDQLEADFNELRSQVSAMTEQRSASKK